MGEAGKDFGFNMEQLEHHLEGTVADHSETDRIKQDQWAQALAEVESLTKSERLEKADAIVSSFDIGKGREAEFSAEELSDALIVCSKKLANLLPQRAAAAKERYEKMRQTYDLQYSPTYQHKLEDVAIDPLELRRAEREAKQLERDAVDPMLNKEILHLRALAAVLDKSSQ